MIRLMFRIALASLVASQVLLCTHARAETPTLLAPGEHNVVINGVRLWYRVAGSASGTPVVFLHGGPGQGSQTFARFAGPYLEPGLRMIYLDQRGSGRSERPWDDAYSLDGIVSDLEGLRQLWGVERMTLVGHSFGTIVALEYAARFPERTAALALISAAPDLPAAFRLQCERLSRIDAAAYARAIEGLAPDEVCNIFTAGREVIDTAMFPRPETRQLVEESDAEGGLKNTGEIGRVLFEAGLARYRFEGHARLTMPVFILAGEKDFQTPAEPQAALAREIGHARFQSYPGLGHFLFVDDPAAIAADLQAFITEATAQR